MGESTEDLAQGFSKYRDEIKALSGVDIMKDKNTFKDMYDIFTELASQWDKMEDISQARVAEILGGKRNMSGIMSTINNIKDATNAYEGAMNSAGTAAKANAIYMDTTKAKVGELKASFQELSSDFLNSELTKGVVDFTTGLVKSIDNIIDRIGSLNTLIAGVGIVKFGKESYKAIQAVSKTGEAVTFKGVTAQISKQTPVLSRWGKAIGNSFSAVGSTLKATHNPLAALSAGFAALQGTMLPVIAIAAGVIGAIKLIDMAHVSAKESVENMKNEMKDYSDAKSELDSVNEQMTETGSRIDELNSKPNLTIVEQAELDKLKETNKELLLQKDILEKKTNKEAREAAKATITAYDKNYKYDINAKTTKAKLEQAQITGNNAALIATPEDISGHIAALKQFTELQNEANKNYKKADSESDKEYYLKEVNRYKDMRQDIKDTISDQLAILEEYRSNLAQLPEDELSKVKGGKKLLNQLNDSIDYIYKSVYPSDWKKIKFSEILSTKGIKESVFDLQMLANETKGAGISVDYIKDKYPQLANEISSAGLSIDDFIEHLRASVKEGGEVVSAIEVMTSALSEYIDTQAKLKQASDNSKSATGLTAEDILNVENAYKHLDSYNPYSLFEETAHGVHLNREELQKLNEELSTQKLETFNNAIADLKNKIYEKRARGEDTSGLEAELQNAKLLRSELEGATSAYNQYLQATSASKERDSYAGIGDAYKVMKETAGNGWYNDEALKAYLDLLLSAEKRTGDARKDFAQLNKTISGTSHSIMDYWKYDKDGNLVSDGLYDFLDDVNKKLGNTFAQKNKDGKYEFNFDGDKIKEVADAFGMSTEAVELFQRALIDTGMVVDLGDIDFEGQIDKAISSLKELQEKEIIDKKIDLDFDVSSASLDDTYAYIEQLRNERLEITPEVNPEAAAALDELISVTETEYFLRLNVETDGGLDTAAGIIQRMRELTATPLTQEVRVANAPEVAQLAKQLSELPASVQIAIGISTENVGNKEAILNQFNSDRDSIRLPVNFKPDKSKADKAISDIEKEKINNKEFDIRANDHASYPILIIQDRLDKLNDKIINVTVNETTNKSKPKKSKGFIGGVLGLFGRAEGTAFANGTIMSMWNSYRNSIGAYSIGRNWSLPHDEKALVNEIGTESIVRDGKWFTIPGGAHVEQLKKGDIIFSAAQTEELIRTGKVTSGGGHGIVAHADGTAFSMINAYDYGTGGGRRPGSGNSTSLGGKPKKSSKKKKPSKSSSKGNKDAKEFEETLDLIEIAINRVTEAINRLKITAGSAFDILSSRNNALNGEISKITQKISLQNQAYNAYMKKASSVGLSESWARKVRDGSIEIVDIKDENLAKKIKEYKEFYEKAIKAKDSVAELNQEIAKLYQDKFNNISKNYEDQLNLLEHLTNSYDKGIENLEERGYLASTNFYQAMQRVEQQNIALQKKELDSLVQAMSDAVNSGKIKQGSEAWYEMQGKINDVKEAIQESENEIIKFQNSIRQIEWDRFDYLQERIGSITNEADFMIDLMEHSKLFEKDGKLTDTGMATAGLHGQNYNVYMAQADKYAEEIKRLNSEIANDPNNTKLIERREELIEAQRDSILAAEDEKEAIRDLVEEGIDLELESLSDLIDKYIDALDTAKDLYDYQKKVEEQTADIVKIQKQLAAYAGDNSEEAKATIQKLQVELKDAKENLKETQYDRFIDEQKALLDHLYSEYENILNSRLDNLDALVTEMIGTINTNSSDINNTLLTQSDKVGYELSESMKSIWANDGSAGSIITKYGDSFTSLLTSVNNVLNGISLKISEMVNASNSSADNIINSATPSTPTRPSGNLPSNQPPSRPSNPPSNRPSSSKGRSETDYYGVALAIVNGGYGWGTGNTRRNRLSAKGFDVGRIQSLVNKMYRDGYVKHGTWKGRYKGIRSLSPYHYNRYKNGGLIDYTGIAQVDGTPSNPEVVLDAQDSKNFIKLRDVLKGISDGSNPISKLLANDSSDIVQKLADINSPKSNTVRNIGDITYHVSIPIEHVSDYNDFMNQMKKDGKFEKMIKSMTVDQLSGGSHLSKNKFKW